MGVTWKQIKGVNYCGIWYLSILLGFFFLYAPLLPLLFINRRLYRKLTDILFTNWEAYNVTLLEICLGVQITISGASMSPGENCLILMNHRTRVDWNFVWNLLFHNCLPTTGHNAKFILKDDIKNIPGLGWIMQMCRFIYVARNWKEDEGRIGTMVEHLTDNDNLDAKMQIVLFPEGTNLTAATKAKSDSFAQANNLKPLKFLLHPRTTGFSCLASKMRERDSLDCIYDVTLNYPDVTPQDEKSLFHGEFPREIHFFVRRFDVKEIPTTVIGLEKWLRDVWQEKECILECLDKSNELLSNEEKLEMDFKLTELVHGRQGKKMNQLINFKPKVLPVQYVILISWTFFVYWTVLNLVLNFYGILWIIGSSGLMILVGRGSNGLQEIEASFQKNGIIKTFCNSVFPSKNKSD